MREDKSKEQIVEGVKELAKEVYTDLAKPIVKSIGSIVSLPFKAIDAALTPIKKWIDRRNANYEETKALLAEKLKGVDESKIVEPEAYVAVPAMQQLSYSYSSEDLRIMYANLLATSMVNDTKWNVHPSFVDIIRQLSPADAKAMNVLYTPDYLTVLKVVVLECETDVYNDILQNYSAELKDIYSDYIQLSSSLENLQRLGLINIDYNRIVKPDSLYEVYENDEFIDAIREQYKDEKDIKVLFRKGLIELTDFGISFCKVCCNAIEEKTKE